MLRSQGAIDLKILRDVLNHLESYIVQSLASRD